MKIVPPWKQSVINTVSYVILFPILFYRLELFFYNYLKTLPVSVPRSFLFLVNSCIVF